VSVTHTISDYRESKGKIFGIQILLFCLLLTEFKNCTRQRQRARWLSGQWDWIRSVWQQLTGFLAPSRAPSQSTLSRLMAGVDLWALKEQFLKAIRLALQEKITGGQVFSSLPESLMHYTMDGKSRKGIESQITGRTEIDLAIWSPELNQVLATHTLHDKEGEATKAASMLKALGRSLPSGIFTGDAGFASPALTSVLVSTGHEYIIGLKGNAGKSYEVAQNLPWDKAPVLSTSFCKGHGRQEERTLKELFVLPGNKEFFEKYKECCYIYQLISKTNRDGKECEDVRYFCASKGLKSLSSKQILELIRNHWSQENNLHWVKDVVLHEDNLPVMGNRSSRVLGFLKDIVVSVGHSMYHSVQKFVDIFDASPEKMTRTLCGIT